MKTTLLLGGALCALALPALADINVTDLRGRTVTLEQPARHVLLGFNYEDFLAVTGPRGAERIAALSRTPWADWRPGQWAAYTAALPALATLPDVGDTETGTFSVEAAIAARPDLAILAGWQFDTLGEGVAQLEAAGIPVVAIDYNAQTVAAHVASTRLLGAVMGEPERAEKLAALYERKMQDTAARVAASDAPRHTVYVELAQKGPGEVGNSYGKGMWAGVIEGVGGENIATGQIENWGPLSPEYVLARQPEVILLAGSEWKNKPEAVLLGFGQDEALAQDRIAAYLRRPGWADLPAVREGRVYAIYHGGARTLSDYVYARAIAKALHPAAFADVDPAAELAEFYADWLPVEPNGPFVVQAK
ncbi:ABC transporter substrate-binding protein [Rhodobacter sp. CZR27]|uniref:ABC transporter substrate-binding protein n=1 Tax=Rhodobacter sp. CZR27 TaxID=2033869 RepID=UPI000BBEAA4A|nr:ABC transporter substrate-binding protein [Rhodobacter sp. CZR27]